MVSWVVAGLTTSVRSGAVRCSAERGKMMLKCGAFANLAHDIDLAVHLPDEPVDHAETESGALADFLGGEERIEYPLQRFGRDAGSGVDPMNAGELGLRASFDHAALSSGHS
jgi:hypothetical protein